MKFKALSDYYSLLKSLGITGIYKVNFFNNKLKRNI